ncbi:hypothetical protein [Gluconobacter kanchanaburiensis]|uniref:Uncharacterized protein n=1 Tax=Gluconobacter kanchanaburiensis NBRC 103587 TaxID=1307948 RepID=A0A511BBM2_9PROT|nr:hypothetical protein [Gluconobacter kanchanaburiensis]MBF0862720.1 hypothetical protein [Gluconobacter kanchanaburiensis]GBR69239.1 hypothetical protein AA103587_1215 [Gluconobacter kanchanaburiensis NBRC 103587]GEK97023.1 hypothetical protein GKA01_22200 [Gluconobacter kanchanaburiensis NBRC 103587]
MYLKKSEPRSKNVIHREVTVTETLVRTVSLVALTLVFASAFRFWQPAIRLAQHMAGTSFWQSLYGLFHIESGLGREQLILSGIVVVCFLLALLVQAVGLLVFRKIRERRN